MNQDLISIPLLKYVNRVKHRTKQTIEISEYIDRYIHAISFAHQKQNHQMVLKETSPKQTPHTNGIKNNLQSF